MVKYLIKNEARCAVIKTEALNEPLRCKRANILDNKTYLGGIISIITVRL